MGAMQSAGNIAPHDLRFLVVTDFTQLIAEDFNIFFRHLFDWLDTSPYERTVSHEKEQKTVRMKLLAAKELKIMSRTNLCALRSQTYPPLAKLYFECASS